MPASVRMQIGHDRYLAAEFVRSARFAFADAFGFRRVPGIQIALVAALLLRDMPGASERVFEPLDRRFGQRGQRRHLATYVADQPPQAYSQKFHLALGASFLLPAQVT